MAVTLELDGAGTANFAVVLSPIAELMACLHTFAEPEHHPEAAGWITKVQGSVSEPLRLQLGRFAPLWARRRCRLLFPVGMTPGRSLDDELQALVALPVPVFTQAAADAVHGANFDTTELLDRPQRAESFVNSCEQRSFTRGELARALVADPERFRDELLHVLTRCQEEFFGAEWRRVEGRLNDEAAQLQRRLHRLPLPQALASLSPTASARSRPLAVRFDKLQELTASVRRRRCLLIPSIHSRPHLIVKVEDGFPVIVHFPVPHGSRASQAALSDIRDRLSILSDPARLSLCRHLVNEPTTTSELAMRTGMTRPQVSRHLARLRAAGLLTSTPSGRMVYHRLDTNRLLDLGAELLRTILR